MDEKAASIGDLPLPTVAPQPTGRLTRSTDSSIPVAEPRFGKYDKLIRVAGFSILAYLAFNAIAEPSLDFKTHHHHAQQHEVDPYFAGLRAKAFEFGSVSPFDAVVDLNKQEKNLAGRFGAGKGCHGKSQKMANEVESDSDSDSDSDNDDDKPHTMKHKHKSHKHKSHKHKHHDKHPHHGKHPHRRPSPPPRPMSPKAAEELFLTIPNNASVAAASYRYTKQQHMAGTGNGLLSALLLKSEYERFLGLPVSGPDEKVYPAGSPENQAAVRGLVHDDVEPSVWVDTYYPIMNAPVSRSVEILNDDTGAVEWRAKLREDIVEGDPTSIDRDEVPVFHGLSASGNVTGPVVYAGYGTFDDFAKLKAAGVSLEGSIALVRYGGIFRGLKIKFAQEAGAIGCIIYSDPGDDGEVTVKNGYKPYPEGPARQASSVQRGSVQFLSLYPGDPSTPNVPAYLNATRLEDLENMPSIPSLPISYQDALPLLQSLQGQGKKASDISDRWVGGLDIDYYVGPGNKQVRFINEVDTKVIPIQNVFAVIPGILRDEIVMIGNHRDAWVLGGADPSSGTASMNEIMRGFSALMKKGWKPLRTIVVASWDAEEYGLIGSTEWAEDFGDFIQANIVAYLNVDVSVAGSNFHASASPSLAKLVQSAAEQINHPTNASRSLWSMEDDGNWQEFYASQGFAAVEHEDDDAIKKVAPLGSGSDYTAFLAHFGVSSTDLGYGGGPKSPVYHYHSIYDSHTWQAKYGDPGFHKHVAASEVLGLMTLRMVDSIVLPFDLVGYTHAMEKYLEKVEHTYKSVSSTLDGEVDFGHLANAIKDVNAAATDLHHEAEEALKKLHRMLPHGPPPHGRPSSLRRAMHHLESLTGGQGCHGRPGQRNEEVKKALKELKKINSKLSGFESGFISELGLKDREWYKHKGVAPGRNLGYGSTTFPAITEALTLDHSAELAQQEVFELSGMLTRMAAKLRA